MHAQSYHPDRPGSSRAEDHGGILPSGAGWLHQHNPWWRHQMETFSALLAICAGNSPVPGEFPAQRPVTRSFDVFFDQRPNKRLSKQSWGWWFETHSPPLWRHSNAERQATAFPVAKATHRKVCLCLLSVKGTLSWPFVVFRVENHRNAFSVFRVSSIFGTG